jgi:Rrf2 family nitric oxide-sensitive transcriptional repressor
MRLNQASDFALRILMLLADQKEAITVDDIAQRLVLVKSHTMKIVAKLVKSDLLVSHRGRNGGIRLARSPDEIFVGEVVRAIEADFAIVECMQTSENAQNCTFLPGCKLRGLMVEARAAFLAVLDTQSLAKITSKPSFATKSK